MNPLAGLFVSALVHVGLLAWGLRSTTSSLGTAAVPYSALITGVAAFGLILVMAIAIFARDTELFFVVVPAMVSGGVYAYTVREVALDLATTPSALAGLLRFGALGVALNLSMAAAALAARTAPIRIKLQLLGADGLWLGWLGLGAVLVASILSSATAPLPLILATTGIIVLQVNLAATQVESRRHSAMAMLVSSVALSLAAVWTASVAASAMTLSRGGDWEPFLVSMRFGWLGAIPLVLAALVALVPRVEATGVGVKFGRTMVLTTVMGATISVGLGGAALAQASYALGPGDQAWSSGLSAYSPAPEAAKGPQISTKPSKHDSPTRGVVQPMQLQDSQLQKSQPSSQAAAPAGPSVVPAASTTAGKSLSYSGKASSVVASVSIDGPLLPADAEPSVQRALKGFSSCHEQSKKHAESLELSVKFTVSERGSVKAIEPAAGVNVDKELFTCLSLSLYRVGFPGAKGQSTLTAKLKFAPAS